MSDLSRGANYANSFYCLMIVLAYFLIPASFNRVLSAGGEAHLNFLDVGNLVQLVILCLSFCVVLYVLWHKALISKYIFNPLKYLIGLYLFYCVTSIWSLYPVYTFIKSIEGVLVIYMCSIAFYSNTEKNILIYLRVTALFYLAVGLMAGQVTSLDVKLTNTAACTIGAAGILYFVSGSGKRNIVDLFIFLLVFYLYRSVTISGALLVSLIAMLAIRNLFLSGVFYLVVALLFAFVVMVIISPEVLAPLLGVIELIFKKDPEFALTLSGRAVIWPILLDKFGGALLGNGFLAAERLLPLFPETPYWAHSWQSAHNSFICAWLGGGIIALVLLFLFQLSLIKQYIYQNFRCNISNNKMLGFGFLWLILIASMFVDGPGQTVSQWLPIVAASVFLASEYKVDNL